MLAGALSLSHVQRARVDAIVERVMREQHVAGLSLGIAREGTRLYLRGYGRRDAATGQSPDGYTIYRAGSLAKQFTAAMVMQQAAAGRVALNDSIGSYLPSAIDGTTTVTIEQLLDQTSGIAPTSDASHATLAFDPGTAWLYSNANYDLLGRLLHAVTGSGYTALLRARIAGPFSLFSTACTPSPFARNVARGYTWHAGWKETMPFDGGIDDAGCASAGLVSNAADLLNWLEDLRAGRIVPPSSFATMTTTGKLANGTPTHYAFGFFIANWFGYTVAEHPGYVGGFSAEDALVLQDGLEIAVLTNAQAVDLTPLAESVVAVLDKPLDRNLSASAPRPPQNENLRITSELKEVARSPRYAAFGVLQSVEFIERSTMRGATYDKYRLTFSSGQWWATVEYGGDEAIESLSLMPVE